MRWTRFWALGAAAGYGLGRLMILLVNRLRLEYEGLYPVLTLSFVLLTYGAAAILGGNGFLAVYVAGLVMALEQSIIMGVALAYLFIRMLAESEEEERRAERYGAA